MVPKRLRSAIGLLVALAMPTSASAAPTWLSPVRVVRRARAYARSTSAATVDADVGMDAAGNAYLAAVVNLGSSRESA